MADGTMYARRSKLRATALIAATLCAWSNGAAAQDAPYPTKPVRLMVAGAPGGNPDVLARLLTQQLSEGFGKPFVVELVSGSNSVLAGKMFAASPPDGYTLMLGESAMMAINPALFADLPYRPLQDFAPITLLVTVPTILVVPASLGVSRLGDFIALAKSKPGALNYGSGGPGSIHHLTMAVFAARTGLKLEHIPYRGGTALVNGLMTGEIQAGWSGIPPVKSLIENGNLHALAASTARRSKALPEVPTALEQGIADFDYGTTIGMLAPAGTPAIIIARLEAAVARAMKNEQVIERMTSLGMDVRESGTAEYANFIKQDYQLYGSVVRDLGIQIK
jgi:tripartite-type tricarboxylate transporter receptor subunit TctC